MVQEKEAESLWLIHHLRVRGVEIFEDQQLAHDLQD